MDLFFVSAMINGKWESVAYWADSPRAASDQAILDGATSASAWPTPADPDIVRQYHGPDFDGRKAYWVIPIDGRESFGVAADNALDAAVCAFDNVGSNDYAMSPVPLTKEEADALLEPGWDL